MTPSPTGEGSFATSGFWLLAAGFQNLASGFRLPASVLSLRRGLRIVLKLPWIVQVTLLTRLGSELSQNLADFIFWSKLGKTPRLPAPLFQLVQNITFDKSRQIATAPLPAAQWTLLS